jgi:hypothetical protein
VFKIKIKGYKSNLLICSNSKIKMTTIQRSCFMVVVFFFFFESPFFISLPFLLSTPLFNFSFLTNFTTPRLLNFWLSLFFPLSCLPYPYIITMNFSNNYLKIKNKKYVDKKKYSLVGSRFFSISMFDFFFLL